MNLYELPEDISLDSVIRVGLVEASIKTFIRYGMVRQEGNRFIKISDYKPMPEIDPTIPRKNPLSLMELQKNGFKVISGDKGGEPLVMVAPGAYCKISDAIRNNLIHINSQPNTTS